jgi:phosphotriesterase-related protein
MALMKRRDLLKAAAMALGSIRESRAAADTNRQINTVLGPIPPSDLGPTLIHEHVLVDIVGAGRIAPGRYDGGEVAGVVLPHLKQLRSQGCRTFVDCTPAYLGRDPALLARLAQSSGLHILTNTGFYGAAGGKYVPEFAFSATAEDLTARWTGEFEAGIPPTGIRPALIKVGVDAGPLSKMNGKLISAAALTHLRTGMAIASHTGDGLAAMAQLNLLKSHGVSPAAFIWVHAQDEKDRSFHRKAADSPASCRNFARAVSTKPKHACSQLRTHGAHSLGATKRLGLTLWALPAPAGGRALTRLRVADCRRFEPDCIGRGKPVVVCGANCA